MKIKGENMSKYTISASDLQDKFNLSSIRAAVVKVCIDSNDVDIALELFNKYIDGYGIKSISFNTHYVDVNSIYEPTLMWDDTHFTITTLANWLKHNRIMMNEYQQEGAFYV